MDPKGGWFDSSTTADPAWDRRWHFLRREYAGTYWSACGPLWLASAPPALAEAPPEDAPVCPTCLERRKRAIIHFRNGQLRSACGARPDDHHASSRTARVTCKRCIDILARHKLLQM